ncbi:MAG: hypothetical protein ACO1RX_20255 [Candidatus Sericytochromatia bacterium]
MTAAALRNALLNGEYNAASLETALLGNSTKGALRDLGGSLLSMRTLLSYPQIVATLLDSDRAWNELLNAETALQALAEGTTSLIELCKRGPNLGSVLSNTARAQLLLEYCNYQLLKQQVNASGSALKRQIFNNSGTWNRPANLYASAAAGVGAGASSGSCNGSANASPGAGGAQAKTALLNHTSITGNVTVTVPAGASSPSSGANPGINGSACTFGGFLSIAGGLAGPAGNSSEQEGGGGGGTTENGGRDAMSDIDFENAAWQAINAAQKGGNGGRTFNSSRNGKPGLTLDGSGRGRYGSQKSTGGSWGGGGGGSTSGGTTSGADIDATKGGGGQGRFNIGVGNPGGNACLVKYWVTDA